MTSLGHPNGIWMGIRSYHDEGRGPGELSLFRRNEQNGTSGRTYLTGIRPLVGVQLEGMGGGSLEE